LFPVFENNILARLRIIFLKCFKAQFEPSAVKQILRKEVSWMKKVFTGALATLMVLSLLACAGTKGDQKVRVKCPACGYEFDAPTE